MRDYLAICPIPNLDIKKEITFANIELYPNMTQEKLESEYKIDFDIMDIFQKEAWTKSPICIIKFSFEDTSNWFSGGHAEVSKLINIITLFKSSVIYIDRGSLWVYPIDGTTLGSGKGDHWGIPEVEYREKIKLDSSEHEDFKKFFEECNKYLLKTTMNNLDKFIKNAIYCLSKVRKEVLPYDRLIFLTIILESLVGSDTEMTYRISHRCAVLIGKDGVERGKIFDMSKNYYSNRSKLVHGSGLTISTSELLNLTELARVMILKFISLSVNNVANTKKDLVAQLDKAVVDDQLRDELKSKSDALFINHSQHNLNFS